MMTAANHYGNHRMLFDPLKGQIHSFDDQLIVFFLLWNDCLFFFAFLTAIS